MRFIDAAEDKSSLPEAARKASLIDRYAYWSNGSQCTARGGKREVLCTDLAAIRYAIM